jgi:Family of unknown function (DUF5335)
VQEKEIPASEWSTFFDRFSRQHEGWLVTVEEVPPGGGGPRTEARDLPLVGVFADPHDRAVAIVMGTKPEQHLTHAVHDPARVVSERTSAGADSGLVIEETGGRTTRIRFKSAGKPEEVDGVLPRR